MNFSRLLRLGLALAVGAPGILAGSGCSKPPPDRSHYVDEGYGFSIDFPKGWSVETGAPGSGVVVTAKETGTENSVVVQFVKDPAGYPVDRWVQKWFAALPFMKLQIWDHDSIDGKAGARTLYSMETKDGALKFVGFAIPDRGRWLMLAGTAREKDFDALLPVLEKSCRSLKFMAQTP